MNNKRVLKMVLSFSFLIVVLGTICIMLPNFQTQEGIYLQYGDSIKDCKIDSNGLEEIHSFPERYKVVLFLDSHCRGCQECFSLINPLNEVLKNSDIRTFVLWRGKVESRLLDEFDIPKDINYSINSKMIMNSFPSYLILDEDKIIMVTDKLDRLLLKLLSLDGVTKEQLVKGANDFFLSKADSLDEPVVVYFKMDGCPDCEKIEGLVDKYSSNNSFTLLKLYTESSYGSEEFVDVKSLFKQIYEIEWYPSFLILNKGEYQIVGEVEQSVLENIISGIN